MTIAQVQAKIDSAVTAIEAEDWSTAKTKLLAAKALLSVLPSRSAAEGSETEIDAGQIDSLLKLVNKELTASQGIQSTLIEYVNAELTDE